MTKTTIPVDPKVKALIFDIDGTLLDTMPIHYKACQIVCKDYGFEFPLDFFYETAGTPTLEVFELLGEQLNISANFKKAALEKEDKYMELLQEGVAPIAVVEEVVKAYHNKIPMACGTGGTREIAELNLERSGMASYFEAVITCDDVQFPKPHPETFIKAAEAINVAPEFCQVFEDGDLGIKAAVDGGMIPTDIRDYV